MIYLTNENSSDPDRWTELSCDVAWLLGALLLPYSMVGHSRDTTGVVCDTGGTDRRTRRPTRSRVSTKVVNASVTVGGVLSHGGNQLRLNDNTPNRTRCTLLCGLNEARRRNIHSRSRLTRTCGEALGMVKVLEGLLQRNSGSWHSSNVR